MNVNGIANKMIIKQQKKLPKQQPYNRIYRAIESDRERDRQTTNKRKITIKNYKVTTTYTCKAHKLLYNTIQFI